MTVRFEVGQNVVCVDASNLSRDPIHSIQEGRVYTVRAVGAVYVRLHEVTPYGGTDGFLPQRFRPCVRTDISDLAKLVVNPPKELVKEDA